MNIMSTDLVEVNVGNMRRSSLSPVSGGPDDLVKLTPKQVSLYLILYGDQNLHTEDGSDSDEDDICTNESSHIQYSTFSAACDLDSSVEPPGRKLNAFERHKANERQLQ
jgi:hypothetical protein